MGDSGKTSGRAPGRPRQQGQEPGRDRLLRVAQHEFARKGYSATSVEELVTIAEVTSPTLYHHFGNKQGLFVAVAKNVYDRTLTAYRSAVHGTESFHDALHALIDASIALMCDEPLLAMMISTMQFELRRDPELGTDLRPVLLEFRAFFDDLAELAPLELRPTPQATLDLSHLLVAVVAGIGSEGLLLRHSDDVTRMLEALRRWVPPPA